MMRQRAEAASFQAPIESGAEELTLAEHQRIVDAIATHDGDAAAEAMHAHLSRANHLYRKLSK